MLEYLFHRGTKKLKSRLVAYAFAADLCYLISVNCKSRSKSFLNWMTSNISSFIVDIRAAYWKWTASAHNDCHFGLSSDARLSIVLNRISSRFHGRELTHDWYWSFKLTQYWLFKILSFKTSISNRNIKLDWTRKFLPNDKSFYFNLYEHRWFMM